MSKIMKYSFPYRQKKQTNRLCYVTYCYSFREHTEQERCNMSAYIYIHTWIQLLPRFFLLFLLTVACEMMHFDSSSLCRDQKDMIGQVCYAGDSLSCPHDHLFLLFLLKIPHTYSPILFNQASEWHIDNVSNDNCCLFLYIIIESVDLTDSDTHTRW